MSSKKSPKNIRLILASKSPRRKELLKKIGVPFEVMKSNYQEEKHDLPPNEFVLKNATHKAEAVAAKLRNGLIIGVDTIASFQHHILEKPANEKEAQAMIRLLNGTTHEVYTGICIINCLTGQKNAAIEVTKVKFTEMNAQEIKEYVASGEWRGKAGGFAIQGLGNLFIEKIEGDYFNVVGLPVFRLYKMLKPFGIDLLQLRAASKDQSND